MLTLKCSRCKNKLMRYKKIGHGRVLRCYIPRIKKLMARLDDGKLKCNSCGNIIGEKEEGFFKMNQHEFTYSGRKINK